MNYDTTPLTVRERSSDQLIEAMYWCQSNLHPTITNLDKAMERLEILNEIMATLEHPDSQAHLPEGLRVATAGWRSRMPLPEKAFPDCQQAALKSTHKES